MKYTIKKTISMAAFFCLLAASLTGCGSDTVTEVAQTNAYSQQEVSQVTSQNSQQSDGEIEAPEMTQGQVEIQEEDVKELIQVGLNAVMEESDLWSIFEVTDTEVLMQLMMISGGGRERPERENFEGEPTAKRTPPDGEFAEIPGGELTDMPQGNGETPPGNRNGVFSEGGRSRGQGGGRQPGNWGGGMAGVALVVSSTEDAVLSKEDILSQIQFAAEELGLKVSSMELPEEQEISIEIPDGHAIKLIVFVNTQIPKMETTEAAG